MTSDDDLSCDGFALAALTDQRQYSVRETVDAAIARIELLNPRLNAVIAERFDAARAQATVMDQSRPENAGPLWGIPLLLKEVNLFSDNLSTRFASRFFAAARRQRHGTSLAAGRARHPW